jgi:phosphatidylserine decarboxylase
VSSAVVAALAVGAAVFSWVLCAVLALAALANLAFFRNPQRAIPSGERNVVAPADGRVVEVARVDDPDGFVSDAWRIAIFLSVFNVHVNRAPLAAVVRAVRRRGSRFLAAFNPQASSLNVQSRLDLETSAGARLALVQITGLVARRIFSYPREGDALARGEPYGLLCYGSRVELYLPADCKISVTPGDRVRGGSSVVAEMPS